MSTNPSVTAPGAPEAPPIVNVAWFLQSQGRRFGPLDEDDMRGYFRAGMVKANDTVAVPGRIGFVSAVDAAALLGMPAPVAVAAPVAAAFATSIIVTPRNEVRSNGGLIALGALVALAGFLYFKLHVPATLDAPASEVGAASAPVQSAPAQPLPQDLISIGDASVASATAPTNVEPPAPPAPPAPAVAAQATGTLQSTPSNIAQDTAGSVQPQAGVDTWWTEAQRLYTAQSWAALVAHAGKWTAAEPRRDLAWWYLGLGHARSGNPTAAIEAYKTGLQVSPNHYAMRWALSDGYIATQQFRDSLEIVNQLIKETPGDARLWNDLGIDQDNLGEYDDAVAAFEKAVQLDPKYGLAWGNLAKSYRHFGYLDRAKDAQEKANAL